MYYYKVGVVGAGLMGSGIAAAVAASGFPVIVKDVTSDLVERGLKSARDVLERRLRKGQLTQDDFDVKAAMLSGTTSYDGFANVDIAIEAVPEKLELKKEVFRELRAACPPKSILASNTSSLSLTEMGATIGLHFFSPAPVMKLVEVVPTVRADAETIETAIAFVESIHKVPIRVKECPGFLVNRILGAYLHESMKMVEEGASPEAVDRACVEFGMPMGPLKLADSTGLEVCLAASRSMGRASPLLEKLVRERRGFFPCAPGPAVSWERPIAAMRAEAARCLADAVASAADINRAMELGTGYPSARRKTVI